MKKILVVEDEKDITLLMKTVLEERGFGVETSESGKDAMKKLEKDAFDLVTIDIFMPEMSGWQVVENLKKSNGNIPVIIYTILESRWAFEKAKQMNCSFVPKSSGNQALLAEVDKLIPV